MFPHAPDEIKKDIEEYERLGVSHILFDPETGSLEETLELLDALSIEVLGHFKG